MKHVEGVRAVPRPSSEPMTSPSLPPPPPVRPPPPLSPLPAWVPQSPRPLENESTAELPWCPWCRLPLTDVRPTACPRCGLSFEGDTADRMMALDRRRCEIDIEEARLRSEIGWQVQERQRLQDAATFLRPPPATAPTERMAAPPSGGSTGFDTSWQSLRAGLLGLGVLLLIVAGVVFVTLAWPRLDDAGRAAVLVAITAVALGLTLGLRRRLPTTSEAFAALFLGFMLVDWYAVRRADVGTALEPNLWWALGTGIVAVVALNLGVLLRLETNRFAAAALAPASGLLFLTAVATTPLPVSLGLSALATVTVGAVVMADRVRWVPAALVLTASAAFFVLGATAFALSTTGADFDYSPAGSALAVAAVAAPFLAARLMSPRARVSPLADAMVAAAVMSVLGALVVLGTSWRTNEWLVVWCALIGTMALVTAQLSGPRVRNGASVAALPYVGIPALFAAWFVAAAALQPLSWLAAPWTAEALDPAQPYEATSSTSAASSQNLFADTSGWVAFAVLVLLAVALAGIAAIDRVRPTRSAVPVGGAAAGIAVVVASAWLIAPLAASATIATAMVADLALILAALAAGAVETRRSTTAGEAPGPPDSSTAPIQASPVTPSPFALTSFGISVVVVAAALGWAAANRWLTLAAIGYLALLWFAGGLVAPVKVRVGMHSLAWVALLSLAFFGPLAIDVAPDATGFMATIASGLALLAAVHLLRGQSLGVIGQVLSGTSLALGIALAYENDLWGAAALTATVAIFALAGLRASDLWYRWAAATTALFATWAWLGAADVTLVEAYTLPAAALALAAGIWGERTDRVNGSWLVYGPGLVLALLPSLALSLEDAGPGRAIVLFVAGFSCVVVGVVRRLQAPFVLGALTVTVLAIDLLGPVAARVERWILLAIAGAVFLWLGATIERRLKQARHAQELFGQFH